MIKVQSIVLFFLLLVGTHAHAMRVVYSSNTQLFFLPSVQRYSVVYSSDYETLLLQRVRHDTMQHMFLAFLIVERTLLHNPQYAQRYDSSFYVPTRKFGTHNAPTKKTLPGAEQSTHKTDSSMQAEKQKIARIEQACAEGRECPICLEALSTIKGETGRQEPRIVITPCNHFLCNDCLTQLRATKEPAHVTAARARLAKQIEEKTPLSDRDQAIISNDSTIVPCPLCRADLTTRNIS